MVEPKTIGQIKTAEPQSPTQRRHDLKVIVPQSQEIRTVEAFNATPAENTVQEIITGGNSSFRFLRLARIVLENGR